jgi:Bacterial SH3 domain
MRIFERFAVGGMILFALSGPVAVAQEENDLEVQPTPVVTIRDAAIRRGPSATAPVATTIYASTPLLVIGHSYGWMRVAGRNNMVGWISREFVGSPAAPAEAFGIGVMSIRAESARPCMANFDSCPPSGCATEKGDKAINERKRCSGSRSRRSPSTTSSLEWDTRFQTRERASTLRPSATPPSARLFPR